MATKHTPLSVQNELTTKVAGFHDRAASIKKAFYEKRQAIRQDDRLTDAAKTADQAELKRAVTEQLQGIKGEQEAYVSGLTSTLAKELAGNQPMDATSIMLRRDASDRARKLETERDALAALRDAVRDGDESMAHAIGTRGRDNGWPDVADAWKAAHPSTSGVAEALHFVESYTSDAGYTLANGAAFSAPTA